MVLPVPFSFSGRIARWPYFKAGIALIVACFLPAALAFGAYPALREGRMGALVGLGVLIGLIGLCIGWISLALQVRRCRDIGWSPWRVLSIEIGLEIVDALAPHVAPSLVLTTHLVSGIYSLLLMLALLFWPSGDHSDDLPSAPSGPRPRVVTPLPRSPVLAAGPSASSLRPSFGRR